MALMLPHLTGRDNVRHGVSSSSRLRRPDSAGTRTTNPRGPGAGAMCPGLEPVDPQHLGELAVLGPQPVAPRRRGRLAEAITSRAGQSHPALLQRIHDHPGLRVVTYRV
jgi:hypothetical protein